MHLGSNDWAEVAWYYENANNWTHLVRQKKENELGLLDMTGNVKSGAPNGSPNPRTSPRNL